MPNEQNETNGVDIEVSVHFPSVAFQKELCSNLIQTGEFLAKPENAGTLSVLLIGALMSVEDKEELLRLRHEILAGMADGGAAEWSFTKYPKLHQFLGRAVSRSEYDRVFTFPSDPTTY